MEYAVAKQLANALGAGGGHAADHDRQFGVLFQKVADQRRSGNALAYRHRVHPQAAGGGRWFEKTKALGNAASVIRRPHGTIKQAQQNQRHK